MFSTPKPTLPTEPMGYTIGPNHSARPDLKTINKTHFGHGYDHAPCVPTPKYQDELLYVRRSSEVKLICRLMTDNATIAHEQLCVYGKHLNGNKRLLAIVMYTIHGTAWLDIADDLTIISARSLGNAHVSQRLARQLTCVGNDVRIYIQTFSEVIREHNNRMSYERRTYRADRFGPHDRKVGDYVPYGRPKKEYR